MLVQWLISGLSLQVPPRQASWEAPSPSIRSTSTTALRIPSSSNEQPRKPSSGIQLQELSPNGIQPPPPVQDSWARIDAWAESHYPELYDQLSYPATAQDVDDLEAELDCSLPPDVRESLMVHDGQDRGGKPTGILFGVTLLDCEEIVEEWQLWKKVAETYVQETLPLPREVESSSSTSTSASRRQSKIFGATQRFQNCRPADTIQRVYAHPAWIPLAKDFSGNNIAVDLSPGPRGTWGQVILFGRECETKYVVARSWASFLSAVADDFEAGEARFDTDDGFRESFRGGELRIRPCQGCRDDSFMEVLKGRVRLREREVRKRREMHAKKMAEKKDKPPVDLMVNSPRMTGDGFPSPNLPRKSDSIAGSPVVGTPITNTPLSPKKRDSVTVSGRDILAKEENKNKVTKLVSGGVVVESPVENVLASPILVRKNGTHIEEKVIEDDAQVEGEEQVKVEQQGNGDIGGGVLASPILIKKSTTTGVEGLQKAVTGLGIEDNGEVSK